MSEIVHTVRNSLIANERTFALEDEGLSWREAGKEGGIAYGDIMQIRVIRYPGVGGTQGQCTINARGGEKLKVRSHHYVSLGNFEDRSVSYRPFVRGLCARARAANGDVACVSGSTTLWVVWVVLLVLSVLVAVGLAFAMIGGAEVGSGVWGALAVLAMMFPVTWKMARSGGGKPLDEDDPIL